MGHGVVHSEPADTESISPHQLGFIFILILSRRSLSKQLRDCDFQENTETKDGNQSKYGGGSAVVVRNLVATDEVCAVSFLDPRALSCKMYLDLLRVIPASTTCLSGIDCSYIAEGGS